MAFISTPFPNIVLKNTTKQTCHITRPFSFTLRKQRVSAPNGQFRMSAAVVDIGSPAVDFTLPADGNKSISLSQLSAAHKTLILYFYPRDATSGCTTEAKDFRDFVPQLAELGAYVVGVSRDSVDSHDAFVKELCLTFPLISDDGTLTEGYGVWKLKKKPDKEYMGIERSTFIIQNGVIVKVWRGIKADGHAAQVVEAVKALS